MSVDYGNRRIDKTEFIMHSLKNQSPDHTYGVCMMTSLKMWDGQIYSKGKLEDFYKSASGKS